MASECGELLFEPSPFGIRTCERLEDYRHGPAARRCLRKVGEFPFNLRESAPDRYRRRAVLVGPIRGQECNDLFEGRFDEPRLQHFCRQMVADRNINHVERGEAGIAADRPSTSRVLPTPVPE